MPNILVYVPEKYRDEDSPDFDEERCLDNKIHVHSIDKDWEHYWEFSNAPIRIQRNKDKVMFTDGTSVIAEGIIIDSDDTRIYFKSLNKVKYPQPKKAPTRGFTYIEN